jgi:hypothetical protein
MGTRIKVDSLSSHHVPLDPLKFQNTDERGEILVSIVIRGVVVEMRLTGLLGQEGKERKASF